jgi:hypothetical protein
VWLGGRIAGVGVEGEGVVTGNESRRVARGASDGGRASARLDTGAAGERLMKNNGRPGRDGKTPARCRQRDGLCRKNENRINANPKKTITAMSK